MRIDSAQSLQQSVPLPEQLLIHYLPTYLGLTNSHRERLDGLHVMHRPLPSGTMTHDYKPIGQGTLLQTIARLLQSPDQNPETERVGFHPTNYSRLELKCFLQSLLRLECLLAKELVQYPEMPVGTIALRPSRGLHRFRQSSHS